MSNYIEVDYNSISRDTDMPDTTKEDNAFDQAVKEEKNNLWTNTELLYEALTENAKLSAVKNLQATYRGSTDVGQKEIGKQVMEWVSEYIHDVAVDNVNSRGDYNDFDMNDIGE